MVVRITKKNGNALNKVKKWSVLNKLGKGGCFKQTRRKGDALNNLTVGRCPKQTEEKKKCPKQTEEEKKNALNKLTIRGCSR